MWSCNSMQVRERVLLNYFSTKLLFVILNIISSQENAPKQKSLLQRKIYEIENV